MSRKVGDGTNTLFWYDMWLGDVPLCRRFSNLFYLAVDKVCSVASMFSQVERKGVRRGDGGEGAGLGGGDGGGVYAFT